VRFRGVVSHAGPERGWPKLEAAETIAFVHRCPGASAVVPVEPTRIYNMHSTAQLTPRQDPPSPFPSLLPALL
jgi:hypothetical protein